MYLVVGLGNPGAQYKNTRHNVGFMYLDYLAQEQDFTFSFDKKFSADIARHEDFIYLKPQTFMNNSGEAVRKTVDYFDPDAIVVVQDELDIPLGEYKIQKNRGDAGHNGIKSIFAHLGTQDIIRIRVGIGKSEVLQNFTKEELDLLQQEFKSIKLSTIIGG